MMDLKTAWSELRRRRVVRVALAYGAVVFALLQTADPVLPALGIAEWVFSLLVLLCLFGFPVVLVLAWIFDLTPEGVRRTESLEERGAEGAPGRNAKGKGFGLFWNIVRATSLIGAMFILGVVAWKYSTAHSAGSPSSSTGSGAPLASIAVLPFVDMSAEGDQAYLGDGMAEEILNLLTRVGGLRVAARTSAFAFRGQEADIREIGRGLDVASVLEGSVRKDSSMVRITAQLIDVASGFHLWSETYDREMRSVFAIQDEISRAIVNALEPTLLGKAANRPRETTPGAYEEYLRGRFQWNRRTGTSLESAIQHFRASTDIDSAFAPAHAGLADAFVLLPLLASDVDPETAWANADAAAAEALRLDPSLAEAWTSSGVLKGFRYDLDGAVHDYRRAIELNPGYATAHHWLSLTLSEMGLHNEAVREARLAQQLDPISAVINHDLALVLLWAGQAVEAEAHIDSRLSDDPDFPGFWYALALANRWQGDFERCGEALVRWAAITGRDPDLYEQVAVHIAEHGVTGEPAELDPAVVTGLESDPTATSGLRASLFALMGEREGALLWLDRSIADRSYADHFPRVNPAFDFLRDDPVFNSILGRLPSTP